MAAAVTEMFTISGESPSLAAVRSNISKVESHCDGCSYVRNVRDFRWKSVTGCSSQQQQQQSWVWLWCALERECVFFFLLFFFYLHGQSTTFSLKLEGAHFSTEDPPTPYPLTRKSAAGRFVLETCMCEAELGVLTAVKVPWIYGREDGRHLWMKICEAESEWVWWYLCMCLHTWVVQKTA